MNTGVYLLPMTAEMYHEYFKEYQNDLDLYIDKGCIYSLYLRGRKSKSVYTTTS